MKTKLVDSKQAALDDGYAGFNQCPHLLVELDNDVQTISVKTPDGNLVTLSFLRRVLGEGHQCVDIMHHNPKAFIKNGDTDVPVQTGWFHGCGPTNARCGVQDMPPTTLIVLGLPL